MGRVCSVLCLPQQVGHPRGCHLVGDREAAGGSASWLGQSAAPEGAQHPHVSRNHRSAPVSRRTLKNPGGLHPSDSCSPAPSQGQPDFQQGNCLSDLKSNLWRGVQAQK